MKDKWDTIKDIISKVVDFSHHKDDILQMIDITEKYFFEENRWKNLKFCLKSEVKKNVSLLYEQILYSMNSIENRSWRDVWRSKDKIYMSRCPYCGLENYGPAVLSGQCSWCAYIPTEEDLKEAGIE